MKIPIVTKIIQNIGKKRMRNLMRGYRFLKASGDINKISNVKLILTNTKIYQCKSGISKIIFGTATKDAELIIRQYLLIRVGELNLNEVLLRISGKNGSKVVHPMPENWRKILQQNGFEVNNLLSSLAWNIFILLMLARGIKSIITISYKSFIEIMLPSSPQLGRYAFFDDLSKINLPISSSKKDRYDIISWYLQWTGKVDKLDTICHSVKNVESRNSQEIPIHYIKTFLMPLTNLLKLMHFIAWGILAVMLSFIDLFRNRWWHAFLLAEAAKAKQLRLQKPANLARVYLLHVSSYIYRPLWSYEAEAKGSQIICYFYSINCESFKQANAAPTEIPFGFQAMNWPNYLVWDNYQADFVRRAVGPDANIEIVGPIFFGGSNIDAKLIPKRTFAIFDVQAYRSSYYQTRALNFDYYTPKIVNQFLLDISQIMIEFDYFFALKCKRKIGKLAHPSYRAILLELSNIKKCIVIDPDVSASALIERCDAVISLPFTSTAILGIKAKKPSVFYDPLSMLQKDDPAAHGIEIIQGRNNLKLWVKSVLDLSGY